MSEYNGTIELISGITPKNGGTFPLVNDKDVLLSNGARLSDLKINGVKPDENGNVQVQGSGGEPYIIKIYTGESEPEITSAFSWSDMLAAIEAERTVVIMDYDSTDSDSNVGVYQLCHLSDEDGVAVFSRPTTTGSLMYTIERDGTLTHDPGGGLVSYYVQALTPEQQAQARSNIGAAADTAPDTSMYEQYFIIDEDGLVSLKSEYRGAGDSKYEYSVSNYGAGVIGSKNSQLPEVLVIPDTVNEIAVTALAPAMFYANAAVKEVTIPSSIKDLPERIFMYAKKLEYLHGTENVESLGNIAFQICGVKRVDFPRLKTINGNATFSSCIYLEYADIGEVTALSPGCFQSCESLTTIRGGEGIRVIPQKAFQYAHRLKNVDFLPNIQQVDKMGLYRCGLNHNWHKHYGCTMGENATPSVYNPTDVWSACTYTPCVYALRNVFEQHSPSMDTSGLTEDEINMARNCVFVSLAHIYSMYEGVDLASPTDFLRLGKSKNAELVDITKYPIGTDANLNAWASAFGYTVENLTYSGNMQKMYDALKEGHLVVGSIMNGAGASNGHAVLFYGVNEAGEIMVCDSSGTSWNKWDYDRALTYTMPIQNMAYIGTIENFQIVKKGA